MENKIDIIKESYSITDASIRIFGYTNGKSNEKVKKIMEENDLPISYFEGLHKNQKWKKIEKNCPVCGEIFETLENHPKEKETCSHKCSNIYFSWKRKLTESKIVNCKICGKEIKKGKTVSPDNWLCEYCRSIYKLKHNCLRCGKPINKKKTGLCRECYNNSNFPSRKGKKMMNERIKSGNHKGWKTRKKLDPSYPEKYFIDLLNNESISFIREEKIGKYFADFLLQKNVILEVDGKQHNYGERKKSDLKKDCFLRKNNYRVYRIKWFNPKNEKNRNMLYSQIDDFINWYYDMFI